MAQTAPFHAHEFLDSQKLPTCMYEMPIATERCGPAPRSTRFSKLMPRRDWMRLPAAVRQRFSAQLAPGESLVYRGVITELRMSRLGWLLAQALRLAGAPLPLDRDAAGRSAVVAVTEAPGGKGQIWTRLTLDPSVNTRSDQWSLSIHDREIDAVATSRHRGTRCCHSCVGGETCRNTRWRIRTGPANSFITSRREGSWRVVFKPIEAICCARRSATACS